MTTTILQYNSSQDLSFVWGTVTFTLNLNLPDYSYTADPSSIPAIQLPQARANLTGVTIGNSVTSIGDRAFKGSGLTSVTFTPTSTLTSIGIEAFYNTKLTSVIIPNSVTTIAKGVFQNSRVLTSVTLPINPLFTSIPQSAFYGCADLTSVTIPDSVTSIGATAFYGCADLISVTIPDSVTSIGARAFYGCTGLTSVTIPDSVTSIIDTAFTASGLTTVYFIAFPKTISGTTFQSPAIGVNFFGATVSTEYSGLLTPTLSNFLDITKNVSDPPFQITAPTTNSNGVFSYTSNNGAVATISGTTVTIVSVGTTTITATQAATSTYTSGTITATLTINKSTITPFFSMKSLFANNAQVFYKPHSLSTGGGSGVRNSRHKQRRT